MTNFYLLFRLTFLSFFMGLLIQSKYEAKKTILIISSWIFTIGVINTAIFLVSDVNFFNKIYPFTVSIPAFICFYLVSKPNPFKVLFSFLTVCNFGMLTSYIGLLGYYFDQSFGTRILFELLAMLPILLLTIKVFRKPYLKILASLDKGWVLLCSFPGLLAGIIYLLLYYPTEIFQHTENIPVVSMVFVLMFVFYAIVYFNFEHISELYQFMHDKEVFLLQTEMQKKEYTTILEQMNAMKIYRHDMRHHVAVVETLLSDNNLKDARIYLRKLSDSLGETVVEEYCENYMVNVILSTYISKAKKEGIEVICKADLSENILIDNIELGLIFTNAIENAILACKKIRNRSERNISIICKTRCEQIYIQICNPYLGEVQFEGEYPISAEKDHGIGTRSIASIAMKHDGIFSFTTEGGIFKTTVILNA